MRKIYISVLSFSMFTLIFGTVTYAWITIATVNNIEGLSLSASTGQELQISTDGFNFSTTLNQVEMEEIFKNQSLTDVTTINGIEFYNGGLQQKGLAKPNRDYVSFELFFRTTQKEKYVYLINNVSDIMSYDGSMEGTYVVSRGIEWKAQTDFLYDIDDVIKKGETRTFYAKDSVRIGFQEVIDRPYDQRSESDLKTLIFDPSKNEHRGFGKPFGAYSYFVNYTGMMIEIPYEMPNTVYDLTKPLEDNPYQANHNESLITEMQPTGYYDEHGKMIYQSKVVVNIWIEGWDADAFDAILKDYIKIQLQFKSMSQKMV